MTLITAQKKPKRECFCEWIQNRYKNTKGQVQNGYRTHVEQKWNRYLLFLVNFLISVNLNT